MKFGAVLFDLDGTLLDTIEDITDSMNIVLKGLGFAGHRAEDYKKFIGQGANQLVMRSLPLGKVDAETVLKIVSLLEKDYAGRSTNKTRPYEGISELLDELSSRKIKMGILSNKPHRFTVQMVEKLLGKWKFGVVMGAGMGFPFKPDPAGAIEVAKVFGLAPEKIIFLGDMEIDIKTASSAGMYPVGALWGFSTAEALTATGAKTLIKNPSDLLQLF